MAFRLFPTTTVNGTNTYKSKVISGKNRRHVMVTLTTVNGGGGNLARKANDLPEEAYAAACGFAMEESQAARETKEAANDVGWRTVPWEESDVPSPIFGSDANLSRAMLSTTTANAVAAAYNPGSVRERYEYTNTLNTSTLDGFCEPTAR